MYFQYHHEVWSLSIQITYRCRGGYLGAVTQEHSLSICKPINMLASFPIANVHTWCTMVIAVVVQSLSCVQLFVTPKAEPYQASLSFTVSWSLLKLMSIESVMLSNDLILCHPLLFLPSTFCTSGSSPMSQFFASGSQRIGASASASVLLMNIQDWFPLGLTGRISLQSKGLSQESSPTPQSKSTNSLVFSLLYGPTLTRIHDYWRKP